MKNRFLICLLLIFFLQGCGKVGPLALSEDVIDKGVLTYPCDSICMKKFEDEKLRQQTVTIQSE